MAKERWDHGTVAGWNNSRTHSRGAVFKQLIGTTGTALKWNNVAVKLPYSITASQWNNVTVGK